MESFSEPCKYVHKWARYYVHRANKVEYRLYSDSSNQFLLSALRVGDDVYISQHEDFPSVACRDAKTPLQGLRKMGQVMVCASLRKETSQGGAQIFKLFSHSCAGCDHILQKYTCGWSRPAAGTWGRDRDRQLLACMTHSKRKIAHTSSEAHFMEVKLPALRQTAAHRCVWCPRTQPADKCGRVPQPCEDEVLRMENQLPTWNPEKRSLSLRFAEGRIKKASAKNFMLTMPKAALASSSAGPEEAKTAVKSVATDKHSVMQFGKAKKQTYVLDVHHPMSVLQAFGIALSTHGWKP